MGPKRSESIIKTNKLSAGIAGALNNTQGAGIVGEAETHQCVGKFAADLELCCREPAPSYPVVIPVYVRSHLSTSIQSQSNRPSSQQQRSRPHSRASITPSVVGEEQPSIPGKKISRPRKSSSGQSGILIEVTGADNDNQSLSNAGQETLKTTSSSYRTFHVVNDIDYYRPKVLVDLVNNENESIDQITALYMRAWKLDQRFIDILKKVLPLQEQLHTFSLRYIGLNEQTINGLVELCQVTKNLKILILDGNPLAANSFHRLIEKDDSKITHLSLRFCEINDKNAECLANVLGNMFTQNWKLLTLNLSGNRIGDNGATAFATALRYNRTLISLNLSSNFITDIGALPLALVLRRINLTKDEIIRRRYLFSKRYAETHPDDLRNNANSPTPSNLSGKSKTNRTDWKRLQDPNRKKNNSKIAQMVIDRRSRAESDDSRPSSRAKVDAKQTRNESTTNTANRVTTLNPPSATTNTSRRQTTNPTSTPTKETDQSRTVAPPRVKKIAAAVSVATKKNIAMVKEEDENTHAEARGTDLNSSGKFVSLQVQQIDRENPLLGTNQVESQQGEIWLKGNLTLLNLNLSRNNLTIKSVKEFLLSVQQQSALTHFNEAFNLSTVTTTSLMDFSGLCRLELKGMNEISIKSVEYQTLETLLQQKNPSIRFQQIKERETKELLDAQLAQATQQLQPIVTEKQVISPEKARGVSNIKTTTQRPTSKLKE